jgi:hypothetical protein
VVVGAVLVAAVAITAFAFAFNLNRFTGYVADDYLYRFVYEGAWPMNGHALEYSNPLQFVQAVGTHMLHWNARFISIIFEIAFMQIPKSVFNVLNALAYVGLGLGISIHASGKRAFCRPIQLAAIFALLWFFIPGFGSTVLWVAGSANYLWPGLITLVFLGFYRFEFRPKKHPALFTFVLVLLGICAGTSNEVGGAIACLAALLYTLGTTDHELVLSRVSGLLAASVAFGGMIILSSQSDETANYGEGQGIIGNLSDIAVRTLDHSGWIIAAALVLLAIVTFVNFRRTPRIGIWRFFTRNPEAQCGAIMLVSALAGCVAMVASPVHPGRLWFAPNVFILVAVFALLDRLGERPGWGVIFDVAVPLVTAAAVTFVAIPSYRIALDDIKASFNIFYTNEQVALAAGDDGTADVGMLGMSPSASEYNPWVGQGYVSGGEPNEAWANAWISQYYHLNSVVLDNSVPLQVTPQQDLRCVRWILDTYERFFGAPADGPMASQLNSVVVDDAAGAGAADATPAPEPHIPADQDWLRNALIRYVDASTGAVVGTEWITAPYNTEYDISHASIPGFATQPGNPTSYVMTQSYHQTIDLTVEPAGHIITVSMSDEQEQVVRTFNVNAGTGQTVTVKAPPGYTFDGGADSDTFTVTQDQNWAKDYLLTRDPVLSSPVFLAVAAAGVLFLISVVTGSVRRIYPQRKPRTGTTQGGAA